MSRAKRQLHLSFVAMDTTTNTPLEASRFLAEIGSQNLQKSQRYEAQMFPKHMETVKGSGGAFVTAKSVHRENKNSNSYIDDES